jgi:hypothetical protein
MGQLLEQLPERQITIRVAPDASVVSIGESLERLFEEQPVSVTDGPSEQASDVVVAQDGEIIATSSTDELLSTIFLINSDTYITDSKGIAEAEFPDVLKALEETPFRLRGYPESDSEKLLLIVMSRAIEQIAYQAETGTLRVGLQAFSRLADEPGTYRVYEQLSETDLDVHIYGVEDTPLPADFGFTANAGTSPFYRQSWFLTFQPPSADGRSAGLFAVERDPNDWEGFWTFQQQRVDSIDHEIEKATMG